MSVWSFNHVMTLNPEQWQEGGAHTSMLARIGVEKITIDIHLYGYRTNAVTDRDPLMCNDEYIEDNRDVKNVTIVMASGAEIQLEDDDDDLYAELSKLYVDELDIDYFFSRR